MSDAECARRALAALRSFRITNAADRAVRQRLARLAASKSPPFPLLVPEACPALRELPALASALTGDRQTLRNGLSFSAPTRDGFRVAYLPPREIADAYRRSGARTTETMSPLATMILQHLDFVTIHPLTDGNGRCARHFLGLRLARRWPGAPRPLPLGAMSVLWGPAMQAAFSVLRARADPEPYIDAMLDVTAAAFGAARDERALIDSIRSRPRPAARSEGF